MALVKSAPRRRADHEKGFFSRVTFIMTMSGSHFMIEALLAPGERNHLLSAVIDQGSLIILSLENSRRRSLIS